MGISGFTYLGITLNLVEPAYLVHVSSVFLFSLRVCEKNWPLWIGPFRFLNSSLYLSYGTIQSLSSFDQVIKFIFASVYVPNQGTKESSSYLYNPPHKGASIFSPNPSTVYDHFTTTMVDISPSGS